MDIDDRLEKARAARAANRAAALSSGKSIEVKDPLAKAMGIPKSLRAAINAKCYDCVGRDADPNWRGSVRECPCTDCPLYNVRQFK